MSNKTHHTYFGEAYSSMTKTGSRVLAGLLVIVIILLAITITTEEQDKKKTANLELKLSIAKQKKINTMQDDLDTASKWRPNNTGGLSPDSGKYNMSDAISIAYGSLTDRELQYIKDYYDMCIEMTDKANAEGNGGDKVPYWYIFGINAAELTPLKSEDGTVPLPNTHINSKWYGTPLKSGRNATFKEVTNEDVGAPKPGTYGTSTVNSSLIVLSENGGRGPFQCQESTVTKDGNGDGKTGDSYSAYDAAYSSITRVKEALDTGVLSDGGDYSGLDVDIKCTILSCIHNRGEGGLKEIWIPEYKDKWASDVKVFITDQNLMDEFTQNRSIGVFVKYMTNELGWQVDNNIAYSSWGISQSDITTPLFTQSIDYKASDLQGLFPKYGGMYKVGSDGTVYAKADGAYIRYIPLSVIYGKYLYGIYTYILGKELGGTYASKAGQSTNSGSLGSLGKYSGNGDSIYTAYYGEYGYLQSQGNGTVSTIGDLANAAEAINKGKVDKSFYDAAYKTNGAANESTNLRGYEGTFAEVGWIGNCPIFPQCDAANSICYAPMYWQTSNNMGDTLYNGCSVFTLSSLLHTVGLGTSPIPKPSGQISSNTNNGLRNGYICPAEIAYAVIAPATGDSVEKLGYEVKQLPTKSKDNWNALFEELKKGIPYAVNICKNGGNAVRRYKADFSDTDSMVPPGGHFVLFLNGVEKNGVRYVQICDSNRVRYDIPNKGNVDPGRVYYNFDDFHDKGLIRYNNAYTVVGVLGSSQTGYTEDAQQFYEKMKQNGKLVIPSTSSVSHTVVVSGNTFDVYIDGTRFLRFLGTVASGINTNSSYNANTVICDSQPVPKLGKKDNSGAVTIQDLYGEADVTH